MQIEAPLIEATRPRIEALLRHILSSPDRWGHYPYRLALEAALGARLVTPKRIEEGLSALPWYDCGPFNSLTFALHQRSGESRWAARFQEEVEAILGKLPVATNSSAPSEPWRHPRREGGAAILIDGFQEEASRCLKLAHLIRAGLIKSKWEPTQLEAMAVTQFQLHERILRQPSGLWAMAQGWRGDAETLSGCWSRAHGWLLRGLLGSFQWLTPDSPHREELRAIFQRVSLALQKVQDPHHGMWPALCDLPPEVSPREASGSAMIAAAWWQGLRLGLLPAQDYATATQQVAETLFRECLTEVGEVLEACPGPGPLYSDQSYRLPEATFPPNEPHGLAAMLLLWEAVMG